MTSRNDPTPALRRGRGRGQTISILATCVALLAAACSGDDATTDTTTTTTTVAAAEAPPVEETTTTTQPPATDAPVPTTEAPPDSLPGENLFPEPVPEFDARPVIFVHGGSGSGAQFQAQAMRFASNGYPVDRLRVVDYNSGNVPDADVPSVLDALIAELQAATGHDQVDLIGHSLGTPVSNGYLTSDPERAANVAHYVNIDGGAFEAPPGGVPTLALWGESGFGRRVGDEEIPGALNVRFPDQAHVEVAATGYRLSDEPDATYALSGDGAWGPFDGDRGGSYEMVIVRGPEDRLHHLYLEPLVRTDHLVRLNTSPPGGGVGALLENSDESVGFVITRYREWWGDQGDGSDVLEIDVTSVVNEATSPRSSNAIAMFAYDLGSDGESNLAEPIGTLFAIGFLTGVDLFVASADPPDANVSVRVAPRGDLSHEVVVNVPNWPSSGHAISVHFVE